MKWEVSWAFVPQCMNTIDSLIFVVNGFFLRANQIDGIDQIYDSTTASTNEHAPCSTLYSYIEIHSNNAHSAFSLPIKQAF